MQTYTADSDSVAVTPFDTDPAWSEPEPYTFTNLPYGSVYGGVYSVDCFDVDGRLVYRRHSFESHEDAIEHARLHLARLDCEIAFLKELKNGC